MASRLVVGLKGTIRKRPILVVLFYLMMVYLTLIAVRNTWEDYNTSLEAVRLLPTRHSPRLWFTIDMACDPSIGVACNPVTDFQFMIAAVPQIASLVLGWMAIEKGNMRLGGAAIAFQVIDMATDAYFKGYGLSASSMAMALVETLVVSTLLSEILLMFCIANLEEYWPLFCAHSGVLLRTIFGGVWELFKASWGRLTKSWGNGEEKESPEETTRTHTYSPATIRGPDSPSSPRGNTTIPMFGARPEPRYEAFDEDRQ